ncbi:MAG: 4Fe-4S binding protein [Acidimicrobiia bacterium]
MNTAVLVCCEKRDGAVASEAVVIVDDLCTRPEQIAELTVDADELVLGLHRDAYALADVQTQCRAAGFDPLGVPIIERGLLTEPTIAPAVLAGASARAAFFEESRPEQTKPVFPKRMTRRSLLGLPKPEYVGVPAIDHAVCAASDGCSACADVCPKDAYRIVSGQVIYDKAACDPCGRCVTVCPTGAIVNPVATPAQIAAQIDGIAGAAAMPVGIAYVCRRRTVAAPPPPWVEVEVPCTGMVTGTWLLAPLLRGAAAVSLVPCSHSGCPLGHDVVVAGVVSFAHELLTSYGLDASRVAVAPSPTELAAPFPIVDVDDAFELHGGPGVILGLVATRDVDAPAPSVEHPSAPVAVVEVDPSACTLCLSCTQACPTSALGHTEEEDLLTLTFDSASCTACGQCVPSCPEVRRGAIRLAPRADEAALTGGRVTLHAAEALRCASCGAPIASSAMMDRIGSLLGDEYEATMGYLTKYCMDCRGA